MADDPLPEELLFEVPTPLGFSVRVTRAYWNLIVTIKHPVMNGRDQEVRTHSEIPARSDRAEAIHMSICSTKRNVSGDGCARFPKG